MDPEVGGEVFFMMERKNCDSEIPRFNKSAILDNL